MRYIMGLDIGIGSIGWAAVQYDEPRKILDFGTRVFESGESNNGKDRKSQARRGFRSGRRLIRRRSHRKYRLKAHLDNIGLVKMDAVNGYFSSGRNDVIALRVKGLDEQLSPEEIAACLINFCNRRGYHDFFEVDDSEMSADEKKEYESERAGAQVIDNIMTTGKYRSVAEMISKDEYFEGTGEFRRYRNGSDKEANLQINREYLKRECTDILKTQKKYYPAILTDRNIDTILDIVFTQRDFEDGPGANFKNSSYRRYTNFLDTYGKCRFFPNENRGCRFTVLADIYALVNVLSQYKYTDKDGIDRLPKELACAFIDFALQNGNITKKDIKAITKKYGVTVNMSDADSKDTLSACLKFIKPLKKLYDELSLDWSSVIAEDYTSMDSTLNRIGIVLSQNQTPSRRIKQLNAINGISPEMVKKLALHKFSGTSSVCDMYMAGAIEAFKEGEIYGSYQAQFIKASEKVDESRAQYKLAPFSKDFEFYKNPVVCRSINETRKLINALIERFGSPYAINIEVASDLNRCYEDRQEIQKNQRANEKDRERINKAICALLGIEKASAVQIERYFLGEQQGWKCLYSGMKIDMKACLSSDSKSYEIDHIIPYSLILDNTRNNKALVFASENQAKGQRTPLMYMDEAKAADFIGRVRTLFSDKKISKKKYEYLMQKGFDAEILGDWKSRNINDTRYIAKFLVHYLKENLIFNHDEDEAYRRTDVYAVKGALTSQMRRLWLNETTWGRADKEELKAVTYLDHAADAVVIACCIPAYLEIAAVQNKLSGIYKRAGKVETDEYRYTLEKCIETMQKFYGMKRSEVEPLLRKRGRTPCLIPTLREESDIRFIEPFTFRWFGTEEHKKMTDDEINALFAKKCAEYYSYDKAFAASLRPVITSHKQSRKLSHEITAANPLSIKVIDGEEWQLSRKSVLAVRKKDIDSIYSGDGEMLDELKKLMEPYEDGYTVETALKAQGKTFFATSGGRRINKVTFKSAAKGRRITKGLPDGGHTVYDATNYYCIELYKTKTGTLNMRGIAYSDLVVSGGKLWLSENCRTPDDYGRYYMYLFPWDYIRVFDKNGKEKFSGYYVSVFNINENRVCFAHNNTPCVARKAVSISKNDSVTKYSIDIFGKIGGEIKCGEQLLSITEKE